MTDIFITYGSLITPIGTDEESTFQAMKKGTLGVKKIESSGFNDENWPLGKIGDLPEKNRFRTLFTSVCESIVSKFGVEFCKNPETLIIVSSTKGEIELLPNDCFTPVREVIQSTFQQTAEPLIISNACISGVLAINTAADYLNSSKYNNAIVIGIDVISDFIVYGFQSLFALSGEPSKPFDKNRTGISIGEAAGCVIMSSKEPTDASFSVRYLGGSSSNDANHISGPSRTGEGLFRSVNKTLSRAKKTTSDIDFISAHGTGTNYNDEMESIAFSRLNLSNVPLNSFKGYFGHTLGAAGIIELIGTMKMMEHGTLLKSPGYNEQGTSQPLAVVSETINANINTALKTASGFGGGNGSILISKGK